MQAINVSIVSPVMGAKICLKLEKFLLEMQYNKAWNASYLLYFKY